jgi:hypothetical protein
MFFIKHNTCVVQKQQLCCDRRMLGLHYIKAVDSVEFDNHYMLRNVSESMIATLYVYVLRESSQ